MKTNHVSEKIYRHAAPEVIFIRNVYFMENWVSAVDTINSPTPHFYSTVTPADHKLPMVSCRSTLTPFCFSISIRFPSYSRHYLTSTYLKVSARDIGKQAAKQLLMPKFEGSSPKIVNHQGPEAYSSNDVKNAFEEVTGKSIELRLIEKDQLHVFFSGFLPPTIVDDFVEMTKSFLPGGITIDDMSPRKDTEFGQDTLIDSFRKMF